MHYINMNEKKILQTFFFKQNRSSVQDLQVFSNFTLNKIYVQLPRNIFIDLTNTPRTLIDVFRFFSKLLIVIAGGHNDILSCARGSR